MENKYYCGDERNFISQIQSAPCILILGEDLSQKDRCFKQIFSLLNISIHDDLNSFLYYGDEYAKDNKFDALFDTLYTVSFFDTPKTVSIKYFETLHNDVKTKVAKYTENPSSSVKLILMAEKLDQKYTSSKTIVKNSLLIETKEMKYPKHLIEWLNVYCPENQLNMDYTAKKFFSEYVQIDTYTAYNEMKKLELYVGNSRTITVNDIKNCTVNSRLYRVYDLTDAIGGRNKKLALEIVENMIGGGESIIMIIATLTNFFFMLWKLKTLKNRGLSDYDIKSQYMKDVRSDYTQNKNLGFVQNISLKYIKKALTELYICDCKAKLSMADDKVLGTSLVLGILGS